MLDDRINDLVLDHFRVKHPGSDKSLNLDKLFYPDYGLKKISSFAKELVDLIEKLKLGNDSKISGPPYDLTLLTDAANKLERCESVALTLQRMHAHVRRISCGNDQNSCCSLVLHGPPARGKLL